MFDLNPFMQGVQTLLDRHNLGQPGTWSRWSVPWEGNPKRRFDLNPYGCADAANILYTLGQFPQAPHDRAHWIAVLQAMQDPTTGLWHEDTHHPFHVTAHCVAALELFDARPLHPLQAMLDLTAPDRLRAFLDNLDWIHKPWSASHQGAGLFAALHNAGQANRDFEDAYFNWLWDHADPDTGLWHRHALTDPDTAPPFHHLAGTFHYLFNLQAARRPLRYPDHLVDTCLAMLDSDTPPNPHFARALGFAEIDWIYCAHRAARQTGHRLDHVLQTTGQLAHGYLNWLTTIDPATHPQADDIHYLFGTLCALAELQTMLPGLIQTPRPLKLVLDRRPFI